MQPGQFNNGQCNLPEQSGPDDEVSNLTPQVKHRVMEESNDTTTFSAELLSLLLFDNKQYFSTSKDCFTLTQFVKICYNIMFVFATDQRSILQPTEESILRSLSPGPGEQQLQLFVGHFPSHHSENICAVCASTIHSTSACWEKQQAPTQVCQTFSSIADNSLRIAPPMNWSHKSI